MPLLVPPLKGEGLAQGDLLKVTALHSTTAEGAPQSVGGAQYALVVSRNCVAEHKGKVIVAPVVAVEKPLLDPDDVKSWKKDLDTGGKKADLYKKRFKVLLAALSHYRDGSLSPDRFYLGPLPEAGNDQRLVALFDELVTLYLPAKDVDAWLSSTRVARLEDQMRLALGTRIFWAFARVGFDDHEWLPDPDLRAVCAAGDAALSAMQSDIGDAKLTLENEKSAGKDERALKGRVGHLANLETEAADFGKQLKPFKDELARRDGSAEPSDSQEAG